MRLPNAEEAIVDLTKLAGYLLSGTAHESFGFSPEEPDELRHARNEQRCGKLAEIGAWDEIHGRRPFGDAR